MNFDKRFVSKKLRFKYIKDKIVAIFVVTAATTFMGVGSINAASTGLRLFTNDTSTNRLEVLDPTGLITAFGVDGGGSIKFTPAYRPNSPVIGQMYVDNGSAASCNHPYFYDGSSWNDLISTTTSGGGSVYCCGYNTGAIMPSCSDGMNSGNGYYSTIGGGCANYSGCNYSFIGAGYGNYSCGEGTFVGGGAYNTSGGSVYNYHCWSWNSWPGNYTFVGAGMYNYVNGDCSAIVAGSYNCNGGFGSYIGAGIYNANYGENSAILAGCYNCIGCGYSNVFVLGSNICPYSNDTTYVNNLCVCGSASGGGIGGGAGVYCCGYNSGAIVPTYWANNYAYGQFSSVLGGCGNYACCDYDTVSGYYNNVCASNSSILGGSYNTISYSGYNSGIVAGNSNYINSANSFIGAGFNNSANGDSSFIGAGSYNTIYGCCSGIIGGTCNNDMGYCNTFLIGSNLYANANDTTYVNNLCVCGCLYTCAGMGGGGSSNPIIGDYMYACGASTGMLGYDCYCSKMMFYDGMCWKSLGGGSSYPVIGDYMYAPCYSPGALGYDCYSCHMMFYDGMSWHCMCSM